MKKRQSTGSRVAYAVVGSSLGLVLGLALPGSVHAEPGVIGIEFAGDAQAGARLEMESVSGVRLQGVQPGSVAALAGLRGGDLIIGINGERVRPRSFNPDQPARQAGRTLDLMVLRDGVVLPFRLVVGPPVNAAAGQVPAQAPGRTAAEAAQADPLRGLVVGARVEVLWGDRWYPAAVRTITGPERWFIEYDGYGSSWNEVVGPDRIRLPGAQAATVASPATSGVTSGARQPQPHEDVLDWPPIPRGARTPIEGVFLTVTTWMNGGITIEVWFFTPNGRFSRSPSGGMSLAALASKPKATAREGTYRVESGQLVMEWANGQTAWRHPYDQTDASLSIGGRFASRQSGFPSGWRLEGVYEGGSSSGTGASSSSRLDFRRDGTYASAGGVYVSSIGRTTEVAAGSTNEGGGTYEFDGFTLILREGGVESRSTVVAFGARDAAGRPEGMYREGVMLQRR
jgi:hypothetical protein